MLLALALIIGIPLVAFVYTKSHKILRDNVREEAEGARETLMPGAHGVGVADYGAINGNGRVGDEERGRSRV
jgi:hypothetical protein